MHETTMLWHECRWEATKRRPYPADDDRLSEQGWDKIYFRIVFMADTMTPEQRSRCMSAIRGKNTKPELHLRRLVHAMGYRYRLHARDLPGKPDLVFRRRRKVIFMHGCFWHRHICKEGRRFPKSNTEFWEAKRERNAIRDTHDVERLTKSGWKVLTLWECELKDPDALLATVRAFLKED